MYKIFSFIGWLILFHLVIIFSYLYGNYKLDKDSQQEQIIAYQKNYSIPKSDSDIYFGYIEFPKYKLERLIKYGDPNKVIEEAYIGIFGSTPINYPKDSLILVGHSRVNQFEILHSMEKHDQINIIKRDKKYIYKIITKKEISADDLSFLNDIKSNQLILITCFDDSTKRLLVICNIIK